MVNKMWRYCEKISDVIRYWESQYERNSSHIVRRLWKNCEWRWIPLLSIKSNQMVHGFFLGKSALGGQRKAQPWSAYLGCPCSYPPGRTYSFVRSKAIHARTAHPYFIKQNPLRGLTLGKLRLTYYLGGWKSDCRFHKCTCLGRFYFFPGYLGP